MAAYRKFHGDTDRQLLAGSRGSQCSPKADEENIGQIGEGLLRGARPHRQPSATTGRSPWSSNAAVSTCDNLIRWCFGGLDFLSFRTRQKARADTMFTITTRRLIDAFVAVLLCAAGMAIWAADAPG